MAKQVLIWRPVTCKSVRGSDFANGLPELISNSRKGLLLEEILRMPRKKSISFEDAIRIASEKQIDIYKFRKFSDPKKSAIEYRWYCENFIQFISDSGFHIELTGDEFVFHLSGMES